MALLRKGYRPQAWMEAQLPQSQESQSQELNDHPGNVRIEKVDQSPVGSLGAHRLGLDPESGDTSPFSHGLLSPSQPGLVGQPPPQPTR